MFQNLGGIASCLGDFLFLRPLITSFTSSMGKGCPVLEGQVAVAGWIMPNSRHEMVRNLFICFVLFFVLFIWETNTHEKNNK